MHFQTQKKLLNKLARNIKKIMKNKYLRKV